MKLELQIKIIDDKDSSVIQQERIVRNINTATAKETDSIPSQFEMRLNQLETIVASLTGENIELKSKVEKLKGPSYAKILEDMGFVRKEQSSPSTPKTDDGEGNTRRLTIFDK